MNLTSAERERQRVAHLVHGEHRPKPPAPRRRAKKRGPVEPARLAPGVEERVALRERWSHKQGTPETHEHFEAQQRRPGAVARLHASLAIDDDQLAAADQIREVYRAITAAVNVRTASFEVRTDGGERGGAGVEAFGRVRDQRTYTAWRQALGARAGDVLTIVIDDVPLTRAARRARMSDRRMRALLANALTLWWQIRRSSGAGGSTSGTSRS